MTARQKQFLLAVEAVASLGFFVWLRWYSGFWRHGWAGLLLGFLYALLAFQGIPAQELLAKRSDISRRVYLVCAAVFLLSGCLNLERFLAAGRTDDGFFGTLMLALALQQGIICLRLSKRARSETGVGQSTHINHV